MSCLPFAYRQAIPETTLTFDWRWINVRCGSTDVQRTIEAINNSKSFEKDQGFGIFSEVCVNQLHIWSERAEKKYIIGSVAAANQLRRWVPA
jgi:hypothetical protein